MPEWWTYTLSDFLLFSPRTYYRLIERYNEAIWPAQILVLALGLCLLLALRHSRQWQGRAFSGLLAVEWIWVALAFLWRRYQPINWAASYFLPLFGLEAVLLIWLGAIRGQLTPVAGTRGGRSVLGAGLLVISILVYPVLAPLAGRGWRAAEIAGLAPDPTAIATLALVLLSARPRWTLAVIPLVWILFSGATLWAMASREAWVVLSAGFLTIVAAVRSRVVPRTTDGAPV